MYELDAKKVFSLLMRYTMPLKMRMDEERMRSAGGIASSVKVIASMSSFESEGYFEAM